MALLNGFALLSKIWIYTSALLASIIEAIGKLLLILFVRASWARSSVVIIPVVFIPNEVLIALATESPTRMPVKEPGPIVTAIRFKSE